MRVPMPSRWVLNEKGSWWPLLLQSPRMVQLRITHYPTPLVGELEGYALLVAQCDHEVCIRVQFAFRKF